MSNNWFSIQARAGIGRINIYDEIGEGGATSQSFHDSLKAIGSVDRIELSINSPGGNIFDAIGIFNMLRRHKARVTVRIDGVAASAASLIAMAGDHITMPSNAFLMLHDPTGGVVGTADDMRDLADALDRVRDAMVGIYAGKSRQSADAIKQMLDAETWLTAEDAHRLGFADEVEQPVQIAAMFDLERRFRVAPQMHQPKPDTWGEVIARFNAQFEARMEPSR